MYYFLIFSTTFIVSILGTLLSIYLAKKFNIIDLPDSERELGTDRKIHKKAVPLFGGFGIFLSFFIVCFFVLNKLTAGDLNFYHWFGVFAGACFLMIGGFLDDKCNLKPSEQIIFPIIAIICVIAGGVGIEKITNPFGGLIILDELFALPYLFTFIWLLGMMYTTKLLDGVDGLVAGVIGIGGFVIFLFTMTTKYYQPDIGLAALILAASCLGFLVFNWHPAKIFLGEGGSLLLGYLLGVLAIISGGKIAIALLVMGIPILDLVWTIIRRLAKGKNPFNFSDKLHLHHMLLNLGLSQRKTVLVFYSFSLIFGLSALFLQSKGKILALGFLVLIMVALVVLLNIFNKKYEKN